jgi:hypothetical protein
VEGYSDLPQQPAQVHMLQQDPDAAHDGRGVCVDLVRGHGQIVAARSPLVADRGHHRDLPLLLEPLHFVVEHVAGRNFASGARNPQHDGAHVRIAAREIEPRLRLRERVLLRKEGRIAFLARDHSIDVDDRDFFLTEEAAALHEHLLCERGASEQLADGDHDATGACRRQENSEDEG